MIQVVKNVFMDLKKNKIKKIIITVNSQKRFIDALIFLKLNSNKVISFVLNVLKIIN